MTMSHALRTGSETEWTDVPTQSIDLAGTTFAYRQLGQSTGVPVIVLNHWGAVLDNFDPRIIDGLAPKRWLEARSGVKMITR